MGVTTKKKIIPIINGEIIFDNKIPNLNQSLFKGLNIFELKIPKKKKIKETPNDQYLMFSLLINVYIAINKKTTKNKILKLINNFFSNQVITKFS